MADVTIDRLQIEIDAISSKAVKGLDALSASLNNVKRSLGGFDTSGIEKVHKALDGISNSAKSVSNVNIAPKVNTSNFTSAERKINNAIEGLQDKLIRLQNLEKAALGGDVSAITSFQRQATSLQGEIDVIISKMKRFDDALIKANGGQRPFSEDFLKLDAQIEKTHEKLKLLQEEYRKVRSGEISIPDDAFVRLRSSISETRTTLDGLIDKQNEMRNNQSAWVDPMKGYRESVLSVQNALDGSKKNIDEFSSSSEQASNAFDGSKITSALSTVASTVKSTTKQFFTLVGKGIRGGINAITKSFVLMKNAVLGVRDQISKLTKWTDKGFMKILKYGFGIRSLYVGFRRLRKAVIASFGELQKSGAFYETTKENIENLKNSLNLLKYQFGAAFEPIFNEVAPALNVFVQHILKAMNAFSAFTAKLMGKDTYSRAVLDTSAIADNTKDAAKAQKELNKQLRGFDELNNLTTSTHNKGGGSGSSNEDDDNITYVTESVDNVLGDFGKELAKNIRAGNWGEVGSAIGTKLTEQLNSIKWDNLKEKAANFGTNLGNFINGLISPDLFDAVGTTIGNAIGTALTAAFYLGKTIKWDNVGESIGAFINGVVKTNPLKLAVENFNVWANGILEALNKAVETVEWKTIGQHIANGIGAVKAWEIAWNLGKLVNSLANAFFTLVSNKDTWKNLGQKIADGINGFFKGMAEIDPKTGLTGWEALGKSITDTITGIADAITVALEKTDWKAVGQGIADFISNIDWKKVIWSLGKMLEAFWEAFKDILKGAELDAKDIAIAIGGIALVINTIAGIKLASSITSAFLGGLIQKAIVGLLTGGGAAGATAGATAGGAAATSGAVATVGIGSVLATVTGVTVGVAASATIGWQFGKTFGDFIATFLSNKGIISKDASDEYMAINEMSITQKIKDIKLAAETGNLKKGWDMMWDEWFEPLFSEGRQISINVKNFALKVAGKATSVKDAWNDFWGDFGEGVFNKVQDISVNIKEAAGSKLSEIKNGIASFAGKVQNAYVNVQENKGSLLSTILSKIASFKDKTLGAKVDVQEDKKSMLGKIKEKIAQVTGNKTVTLGTKIKKGATKKITSLKKALAKLKSEKTIKIGVKNAPGSQLSDISSKFKDMHDDLEYLQMNGEVKVTARFNDKFTTQLESAWKRLINAMKFKKGAKGGVYSSGSWKNIPQYASGTTDALKHGSVFVAGEAGPEVVGHINGRTEILNRSQIASTMYTAITRGMAQFKNAQMVKPQQAQISSGVVNGIVNGMARANDSEAMQEQNRLLEEQNRLLRQILNKPTGITSRDVFNATRAEAQSYNNRTGNSPFIF